ncbi:hypothetical protein ERJ75_001747400 [Trypanosoma vivax]|uniref:Uncharacterized protein n=1 Tax=Trypanosoma vivax (strain Y486) TaxID=1055687 RepID=G0U2N1_TRYVY|nr:hypothetical protein TRVL_02197 [Trypanosoma vivax]KAH8604138.1 hypothetical protein ERJ75_001747400 [Trypanosoma vivax]CCC50534.1 conserved hypothetical protein [Trypanosoma vivax Y486]
MSRRILATVHRRQFVGPFTRFRAWWLGIEDAELLARYGEPSPLRFAWAKWRSTLVVLSCIGVYFINSAQVNRANEILDNIELNRQRYYKRDFSPEYVPNAPEAVYDGPKGYAYRDEVSGLMVNADRKLVSDISREERRERLASANITPSMVEAARELRQRSHYQLADEGVRIKQGTSKNGV